MVFLILIGMSIPFAFPPFNFVPSIFLGHILLFLVIVKAIDSKQAFMYGLAFSLGEYLIGFYWIFSIVEGHQFSYQLAMSLIILGIIGIIALLLALSCFVIRSFCCQNILWFLFFPASVFSFYEWLKSWLFTGFPWYAASDALGSLGVYGLLPIFGYLGICWLFYAFVGLIAYLVFNYKESKAYASVIFFIIFVGGASFFAKGINWTQDQSSVSTRIITGDYSKSQASRIESINRYNKFLSLSNTEPTAEITLWPESSIHLDYQDIKSHLKTNIGKTSIFAGIYFNENNSSTNSLVNLNREESVYYKEHLIPFGEYTPGWFSLFASFIPEITMDNLKTFPNNTNFRHKDIVMFASICFEALFSVELLERSKDAHLHLHASNLGWFDNSIAVEYLLNILQMRAIETSKPILYSVNKGYSAVIDHKGRIAAKQQKQGTYLLDYEITTQKGTTPYAEYRNFPILIFIGLVLIIFMYRSRKFFLQRLINKL